MSNLSKAEKLLVAAGRMMQHGKVDITIEDLVVSALESFPSDFALKGYPQHPDSNLVFTQVMGKKAPLVVRGWLEKTGTKQYRLTAKGIHEYAALDSGAEHSARAQLERTREESLVRLFASDAYRMYRDGRGEEITFHQYCRFIGLSARDRWQKVVGRLSDVEHVLEEGKLIGEAGQSISVHHAGRNQVLSADDLRSLPALFQHLRARFATEMNEWRQNAGG